MCTYQKKSLGLYVCFLKYTSLLECTYIKIKHFYWDFSGLANKKTVTIQPEGKSRSVLLATTKTKKQNKPVALFHKSVMKKEFRRMANAVSNQVI